MLFLGAPGLPVAVFAFGMVKAAETDSLPSNGDDRGVVCKSQGEWSFLLKSFAIWLTVFLSGSPVLSAPCTPALFGVQSSADDWISSCLLVSTSCVSLISSSSFLRSGMHQHCGLLGCLLHRFSTRMQCHTRTFQRRTLKSTLHPTIFWEMVKFVALGVLYFSLVLPL